MVGAALLGIDLGTTAVKVGLFDVEAGECLVVAWREYEATAPQPGWAELPAETYWRATVEAVREACAKARQPEVLGLGLSSQGQTFVLLDEAQKPLRPAVVWLDTRAEAEAERLRQALDPVEYRINMGGVRLSVVDSASKLLWLREHEPEVWAKTRYVLLLPDYLGLLLTGERRLDVSGAASTGMVQSREMKWWPAALEAVGVREEWLSELGRAGERLGLLRPEAAAELGLPAGLPVALGAMDQLAGAVGVANLRPGIVSGTVGTALALVATVAEVDDPGKLGLLSGPHPAPGLWFLLSYAKTCAIVLTWLRSLSAPGADYAGLLAEAATVPAGAEGLVCLPHFSGTGTPAFRSDVRGALLGLKLGHTRGHLIRAVAEAAGWGARDALELMAQAGARPAEVRMLGGATRSDWWMQTLADILELPLVVPACGEAPVLGAALFAGVATGAFANLEEAAGRFYRVEREYEPRPEAAEYAAPYGAYRAAMERLYPGALECGHTPEGG